MTAMATDDPYDLQRFVTAQEAGGTYQQALAELRAGRKASHWMWFVFPQLKGLGRSSTAQHYGIASADEARAYWEHPLLGPRLKECTGLMLAVSGKSALQILGSPDDLKFRSSMTLFEHVAPEEPAFARAIERYFGGERDAATIALLR